MKNMKLITVCKGSNLKNSVKAIGIITDRLIKNKSATAETVTQ